MPFIYAQDYECSSDVCADRRTNYVGSGWTTVSSNYRCAPSNNYCVDTINPYYHSSGSR